VHILYGARMVVCYDNGTQVPHDGVGFSSAPVILATADALRCLGNL